MTGYTIYYQREEGERRSLRTEAGATTANISGLISGASYSMAVLSTLFPRNEIVQQFITIGTYYLHYNKMISTKI